MPGFKHRPCRGTKNGVHAMERSSFPGFPVFAMPSFLIVTGPAAFACFIFRILELLRSKFP